MIMDAKTFLACTGSGLARVERTADGAWTVQFPLEGQGVRCLAADPLRPEIVYVGTQGAGVLRSEDRGQSWRPASFLARSSPPSGQTPPRRRSGPS